MKRPGVCCADLEERVAELEATTVRKGNRKVSLKISGFVGHQVMWWDDGSQSDSYIGDGGNIFSRFRFTGEAKISPTLSAGFTYEFGLNNNAISSMNQLNGGDDLGECTNSCIRDTTVWLKHSQLGMVKIGQGSTATDNLILIDLGNRSAAATADSALYNGGFILRGNNGRLASTTGASLNAAASATTGAAAASLVGMTWASMIRGNESFDTTRRNHVMYQTPTLAGFTVQAAVAEDNYWDVALRYAGEFSGFRVAFGIGYQENSEFNADPSAAFGQASNGPGLNSVQCNRFCDVKASDLKGSASVLHVPTGLFLTGAAGQRELDGTQTAGVATSAYAGPDLTWWYLSGGISQNFFGIGKTVLFGEYQQAEGGMEQSAFLGRWTGYNNNFVNTAGSSSEMEMWGLGITQHVDAAAMEVFATYKNFSSEATGFLLDNASMNKGAGGMADFSTVIVGTRINF